MDLPKKLKKLATKIFQKEKQIFIFTIKQNLKSNFHMSNINDLMKIINSPGIAEDIQKRGEEIDIALKIKEKRLKLGWTQSELASKMGVAQNVISRIESLEGGVSSGTIAKFCKATGLELNFDFPSGKLTLFDMANYIIQYGEEKLGKNFDISNLKINKLVFFVEQAIVKAMNFRTFDWQVQAWEHGPVYPQLYYRYCGFGRDTIKEPNNNVSIPESLARIVNAKLEEKIYFSAKELEDQSHQEKEWKNVYKKGVKFIELKFEVNN
jgi:uncharacterized phage-associated protein/DNA-binding Xre family transcriptional regulator